MADALVQESLMVALNRDALEEVFLHCGPADLLAVRQTCGAAADLLARSEKVWLAKLRESFALSLKAPPGSGDQGLCMRLARRVYEAGCSQALRFQGVYVGGGIDEDAMHYFADNLFRADKAPYCSNSSSNADCLALLLDGEVPRDAEFAQVRKYMIKRCRYAAALIMNVQMPEHGRDPDDIMRILEDWTDIQLEGFFKDLVGAMQAEHALGRLLVYDIPHERLPAEEQKILGVHQWLLERPLAMQAAMLKPAGQPNAMLDTSVLPKLCGGEGRVHLAGVVHEVALSRVGNLTCPVAAGAVLVGHLDHSKLSGWSAEQVLALLQQAVSEPAAAAFNGLGEAGEVAAASAAGLLPPIAATDETLAGVWHEFGACEEWSTRQAAAAAAGPAARRGGEGDDDADAAAAAGPARGGGAASGPAGQQVSTAGIISWRPLLWFKFHSAEEAVSFLQRNRPLIEQHGSQAVVRHRGPAPTRRGHVAAADAQAAAEAAAVAAAAQQQQQQQQHQQQQGAGDVVQQQAGWLAGQLQQAAAHAQQIQAQVQQQQQQQAAPAHAMGVPVGQPWAAQGVPAAVAGVPAPQPAAPVMGMAAGAAAAADLAVAVAAAEGPGSQDGEGDSESSSLGLDDDDMTDDSGSELEEGGQGAGQGAWLANWVDDEFGADLQQEADVVVAGEGLPFDQMDEGSSSGGDSDDEALLGAEGHLGLGAAGGGGAGPGGAGPQVQPSVAETLLRALTRRSTRARNRLRVPLAQPVGANMLLVKLVNQENLMAEYGDPHSWPNIDMTSVLLAGRAVELPEGVVLSAAPPAPPAPL